jgi:uncharacterized protein
MLIAKKSCFVAVLLVFVFLVSIFSWQPLALAETPVANPPVDDALYLEEKLRTNAGTVSIMVSGLNCTCMQFAEDIRNVVNEIKPGGQRALLSVGEGGFHNLKDAIFLLGVHMTIVDEHDLRRLKESNPAVYGDADQKLRYITKLYNAEFHILARKDIASIADLKGKSVNVERQKGQTDTVAKEIFGALGIDIQPTYHDDALAQQKLLSGEIAAMVLSTGAPQESLLQLSKEDVHFLALDEAAVPGADLKPILTDYLPAELTSDYYPNLIAPGETVPTIASRMVLAIYNWPENGERYNRNTQYIREFFSKIDQFRHPSRHPKWKEVNIAAEVPGWTRFKPAQDWLDRNQSALSTASVTKVDGPDGQKAAFESFLASRGANGQLTENQREALFREFQKFMETRQ